MLIYEFGQQIITKCWSIEITKILRAKFLGLSHHLITGHQLEKFEIGKTNTVCNYYAGMSEDKTNYSSKIIR